MNFQFLAVNYKAASLLSSPLPLAYVECVSISYPAGPPASVRGPVELDDRVPRESADGIVAFYGYVGDSAALNSDDR